MNRAAKWKLYELFVARLLRDSISTAVTVTPNARIRGAITGVQRQIDVLIEARHDTDDTRRIIVDAKARKRKIDVTHVETFEGLMKDSNATHGLLVCPKDHTKAAEKRAQRTISIHLVPLSYLEHFDPSSWELCRNQHCKRGHVFWDGYPELNFGLTPLSNPAASRLVIPYVHSVGKCERCRQFHVKCFTCGTMVSLSGEDEFRCQCNTPWFWLSSIETDEEDGRQSAELHVVMANGNVVTTDRRSL